MASAKIYIPNRIYENGTTPIYLQIIIDRQKFKKTIYAVEPEFIDRKNKQVKAKHPNAVRINQLIHKHLANAKTYLLDCIYNDEPMDPNGFFNKAKTGDDILSHLKAREKSLRSMGSIRRADTFKVVCVKITDAGLNLKLHQINLDWIEKFNKKMVVDQIGPGTRGLYFSVLNGLIKRLMAQGLMKSNPFIDFQIPSGSGSKEKYSLAEFNIIRTMPLTGKIHWTRQMWVFATLARGMRAFDVLTLKWSNIQDGRLKYTAQKTKKEFDIGISPAMEECLKDLPSNREYVFPFIKLASSIMRNDLETYLKHVTSKNSQLNQTYLAKIQKLSGISKHLTMHVARHTFSGIMLKNKTDLSTIQEFLGHSDIKTTMKYASEIMKVEELDDAVKGGFDY